MDWFGYAKVFVLAFIIFVAIDMLWIGVIAKSFYNAELGSNAKTPNIPAALITWALIVAGIMVFVMPLAKESVWMALGIGALFGLVLYGVYDLTNLAVLKGWTIKMTLVDMAWGATVCATNSVIIRYLMKFLM